MNSDFKLDDIGDIVFTPDGDLETIEDDLLILQDLRAELEIAYGSIEWDPEAGSDMLFFLNAVDVSDETIIAELERITLKDPRIAADSIQAEKIDTNKFQLQFKPLSSLQEKSIVYERNN